MVSILTAGRGGAAEILAETVLQKGGSAMSEQNQAVVRRIIEDYWNEKNPALATELFGATCSLHTPDGDLHGMKGVAQLLDVYASAFPDFRITLEDMVAGGDRVAVRQSFAGTHKGPLGEIAASGNRITLPVLVIFRFAGGKVAEAHFLWDRVSLQQQIGALARASGQAAL
jgi:predicted ester cyclase